MIYRRIFCYFEMKLLKSEGYSPPSVSVVLQSHDIIAESSSPTHNDNNNNNPPQLLPQYSKSDVSSTAESGQYGTFDKDKSPSSSQKEQQPVRSAAPAPSGGIDVDID